MSKAIGGIWWRRETGDVIGEWHWFTRFPSCLEPIPECHAFSMTTAEREQAEKLPLGDPADAPPHNRSGYLLATGVCRRCWELAGNKP